LVVLNDSILDVPEDKIKDIQVEMTIIDGEIVFQKEPTKSLNA
jgi:predicted amidohydrolase YtcJ